MSEQREHDDHDTAEEDDWQTATEDANIHRSKRRCSVSSASSGCDRLGLANRRQSSYAGHVLKPPPAPLSCAHTIYPVLAAELGDFFFSSTR